MQAHSVLSLALWFPNPPGGARCAWLARCVCARLHFSSRRRTQDVVPKSTPIAANAVAALAWVAARDVNGLLSVLCPADAAGARSRRPRAARRQRVESTDHRQQHPAMQCCGLLWLQRMCCEATATYRRRTCRYGLQQFASRDRRWCSRLEATEHCGGRRGGGLMAHEHPSRKLSCPRQQEIQHGGGRVGIGQHREQSQGIATKQRAALG